MKKSIIVTGSSGFIGGHLVRYLKKHGHTVIGVDIEQPQYEGPDLFFQYDLRNQDLVNRLFSEAKYIQEVYNLAATMGGMGYIGNPEHSYDIMVGSSQIISNVLDCCIKHNVEKVFYSSSACVYNMALQDEVDASLKEEDAYPAMPDLVYGWQKLFGEQMHQAAAESYNLNIRIARFHNIFGPEGVFKGGKEKAPAALCRKVAEANNGDQIEVWGDGKQTRSFLYIDSCIEGIMRLMASDYKYPLNIGSDLQVTINDLAQIIISISNKSLGVKYIPGPVGVKGRNSDNDLIKQILNWSPDHNLLKGLEKTYEWIEKQIS